jgi:predicted transcriptional regulator
VVDAAQIASLRASGASWQQIADRMEIGVGTACRAFRQASKNRLCAGIWRKA